MPGWRSVLLVGSLVAFYLYMRLGNPLLTPDKMRQHYTLLARLQNFCQTYNITLWVVAGTLLGAVRHQGLIPWDNDIDVAVMSADFQRLRKMRNKLALHGLAVTYNASAGLHKVFLFEDGVDRKLWHSIACVDIFDFAPQSDGTVTYATAKFRRQWPREWFAPDELKNLQAYTFGPLSVPGPSNAEAVCRRMWGPNWRTPVIRPLFRILYPLRTRALVKQWQDSGSQQ